MTSPNHLTLLEEAQPRVEALRLIMQQRAMGEPSPARVYLNELAARLHPELRPEEE